MSHTKLQGLMNELENLQISLSAVEESVSNLPGDSLENLNTNLAVSKPLKFTAILYTINREAPKQY